MDWESFSLRTRRSLWLRSSRSRYLDSRNGSGHDREHRHGVNRPDRRSFRFNRSATGAASATGTRCFRRRPDDPDAGMDEFHEIEADPRILHAGHAVGIILEGIGYSVYARIVPLPVVADLMGGTARLAWRKLRPYIEEARRRSGSQKTFEWFQWLAVQLERYSPGKTDLQIGAQEAYRNWRP